MGTQEFSDMMAGIGYMTPRPADNKLYGKITPNYIKLGPRMGCGEQAKMERCLEGKV